MNLDYGQITVTFPTGIEATFVPGDAGYPLAQEINRLHGEVKHWKDHAEEAGAGFAQVCRDAARYTARNRVLVEGILRLADAIHGDSGWAHNAGCEGEPDCFACIEADLRRLVSVNPTSPGGTA